ncbi:MAG: tetratricopeptide repeat protein [Desulfobulbaceae bacterium]|jgi:hypothetical protein|nr:tetratricopeptide repeat protein [Desulfobulbaceae bacterium]
MNNEIVPMNILLSRDTAMPRQCFFPFFSHRRCFAPLLLVCAMLILSGCAGKVVLTPPVEGAPPVTRPDEQASGRTEGKTDEHPTKPAPPSRDDGQPDKRTGEQTDDQKNDQAEQQSEPFSQTDEEQWDEDEEAGQDSSYQPKLGPAASLYNQGESYLRDGRLDKAEMSLERALRIEPRNPDYWHTMAEIRFRQGKKREAVQCCLKSNSLAVGVARLIRKNDELIARAKAEDDESFE